MFTKITRIDTEATFNPYGDCYCSDYAGYEIFLENGDSYFFGIEDAQHCCEAWGYFTTHDNVEEFVGTQLIDIQFTSTALNTQVVSDILKGYYECASVGDCQFVTVKTNKGDFQLVVYNAHNGYYGHKVAVFHKTTKDTTLLEHDYL